MNITAKIEPSVGVWTETVFLATQNSSGVNRIELDVRDGMIYRERNERIGMWLHLVPPALLSRIGDGSDWRTAHFFKTEDEARASYIALERQRIAIAQRAIETVAA